MNIIWFSAVKEENGWMSNMAPYPILFEGKIWGTSEALFQSLRYDDEEIKEIIRKEKSPMAAKMKAKKRIYVSKRIVVPMSGRDVENMKMCIRLKFEQHADLRKLLIDTGESLIFEDINERKKENDKFWGARKISENKAEGKNMLGEILMEIRKGFSIK
jgi:ribA/ribD-fused uncharacterized protein